MFRSNIWLVEKGKYSRSLSCWNQNAESVKKMTKIGKKKKEKLEDGRCGTYRSYTYQA